MTSANDSFEPRMYVLEQIHFCEKIISTRMLKIIRFQMRCLHFFFNLNICIVYIETSFMPFYLNFESTCVFLKKWKKKRFHTFLWDCGDEFDAKLICRLLIRYLPELYYTQMLKQIWRLIFIQMFRNEYTQKGRIYNLCQ